MGKQIIKIGSEARKQLSAGIDILANTVTATLGPNGRNVVYGKGSSTKDGVTVAKAIERLDDPVENMGVKMIKQAAIQTSDVAGDGTTTSTLLAQGMVKRGLIYLDRNENAVEIKRGIDVAVSEVIKSLRENREEISSEEQLQQIATISSNNDETIGKMIAKAFDSVGQEGVVHIEESKTGETYLEITEGIQFNRGYSSPYFVTDNNKMSAILQEPNILIYDGDLKNAKELLPILQDCSVNKKSLVIIANSIEGEALAVLIVNKARGTLSCVAIASPDFGERRTLILEDIATMTGGTVVSKQKGTRLDKFNKEWFGTSRAISVEKEKTTIIDGGGLEEEINERALFIKGQIDNSESPFATEKLQERLANMAGGIAMIHVGGYTKTELEEKKDRVDDALQATKAALEEGIVPGGGMALLRARESITNLSNIGAKIVYDVCGEPFTKILSNAGLKDIIKGSFFRPKKKLSSLIMAYENYWMGYNIKKEEISNLKDDGIIDPAKVTRVALENAASIAGTILLTEAVIVDEEETNEMDPMMGMM